MEEKKEEGEDDDSVFCVSVLIFFNLVVVNYGFERERERVGLKGEGIEETTKLVTEFIGYVV